MKISVVIPAYNEEEVLGPCLQTILHSIELSPLKEGEWEVIVVDNASTDHTREVAESFPGVRVVHEPRKGITWAKEAGFRAAKGEFIVHPDADTLMPPHWISMALPEFEKDSNLVALTGPYVYYDGSFFIRFLTWLWLLPSFVFHLFARDILHAGAMIQGGNYIVRRAALEAVNGYDTTIEFYGEDFDIASRLSKVGKVKWTWKFPMYSSSRRLKAEGTVMTAFRYGINNVASTLVKHPVTYTHVDIRPTLGQQAKEAADMLIHQGRL